MNYRKIVKSNQSTIQKYINEVLDGKHLDEIEPILLRIDSSHKVPHWFATLKNENRLPNLDGKTVGSVLEKILVCVIEKFVCKDAIKLSVNPAKGVDIPELPLGVKSPSTNFCTSEPYFSAYERLLGNEYDAIVLLTNYQQAKNKTPFNLKIISIQYLNGTEIADSKLCRIAKGLRDTVDDEPLLKKAIRFLSYINQSEWEANQIIHLIDKCILGDCDIAQEIELIKKDFDLKNTKNDKEGKPLIPDESLKNILAIQSKTPQTEAIINAGDNWVIQTQKDNGRLPNDNEWHRFINSPLDGKIGMSFALQWRYNFSQIFSEKTRQ